MRGEKKDYISEIIRQGAFDLPPKPPVAEAGADVGVELETEGEAEGLPDREPVHEALTDAGPALVECVAVWWKDDDPLGRTPLGIARPHTHKKKSRTGFLFKGSDVITLGLETIRVGTMVRGRVIEPESGSFLPRLMDVEVYKQKS